MKKILLINPAFKDSLHSNIKVLALSPLNLAIIARYTPEHYEVQIVDEAMEDLELVTLSSLTQPISMSVNVDLPLAVGIPADYIADQDLRLRLYRRIADLRDETEIDALASEFRDRFGKLPEMTQNLFYQMRVKVARGEGGVVLHQLGEWADRFAVCIFRGGKGWETAGRSWSGGARRPVILLVHVRGELAVQTSGICWLCCNSFC